MKKVISEDALRKALKRIPEKEGTALLDTHLANNSVVPLLDAPWILDTDTTIKPLYGHQEGAVIGYNPRKPGRLLHAYHTYLMVHAHFGKARALLVRVSALLQQWVAQAAEQLHPVTVWTRVCDHLKQIIAGIGPPKVLRLLENNANGIG